MAQGYSVHSRHSSRSPRRDVVGLGTRIREGQAPPACEGTLCVSFALKIKLISRGLDTCPGCGWGSGSVSGCAQPPAPGLALQLVLCVQDIMRMTVPGDPGALCGPGQWLSHFVVSGPHILLKIIGDSRELLFMWVVSIHSPH